MLETHVRQDSFLAFSSHILPGWTCSTNYEYAPLGRIWIFHDPDVKMELFLASDQAIHCYSFSLVHKKYFLLSVIYASNSSSDRRNLWTEIQHVKALMTNVPWLVCDDFNTELYMADRSDYYDGMACSQSSLEFRQCLDVAELYELPCSSPFFTWSNKRVSGFLAKRLDRFLVNESWMDSFDELKASFLPPDFSDHSAGILVATDQQRKHGTFKFFNYLIGHKGFLTTVTHHWNSLSFFGTHMYHLCKLLQSLKPVLRGLNKTYNGIQEQVLMAHDKLLQLQSAALIAPSSTASEAVAAQEAVYAEVVAVEEAFLK